MGNTFWCAPEMIDTGQQRAGRAVDIWSFGILLLEMVYNTLPFARGKDSHLPYIFQLCFHKKLPDIPHFLDHEVKQLISRCLVFDAKLRPCTEQLLDEFFSHLPEAGGVCEGDGASGEENVAPVRRARKTGLPDIWNSPSTNPRHRKVGVPGPKGPSREDSVTGSESDSVDGCEVTTGSEGDKSRNPSSSTHPISPTTPTTPTTPTGRPRRAPVCYSPHEITEKLLFF